MSPRRRRERRHRGEPLVVRVQVEIEPTGRAWTPTTVRDTRPETGPKRAVVGELIEDVIWRRHT